jgi:hypothetical protein
MQKIVSISSHKYSVITRKSVYFLHCHGYVSLSRINLSRYKIQRSFLCLGWQVYGVDTA